MLFILVATCCPVLRFQWISWRMGDILQSVCVTDELNNLLCAMAALCQHSCSVAASCGWGPCSLLWRNGYCYGQCWGSCLERSPNVHRHNYGWGNPEAHLFFSLPCITIVVNAINFNSIWRWEELSSIWKNRKQWHCNMGSIEALGVYGFWDHLWGWYTVLTGHAMIHIISWVWTWN
jgi:hypothetical protein